MKKLLLTALAAGVLATSAPAALADHVGYAGPGCDFNTVNDTTPGGQLGGENQWNGEISVLAVATDAAGTPTLTEPIDVTCELRINGTSQGTVFGASGVGVAAAADQFAFTATSDDVVTLCTHATIDGHTVTVCIDSTVIQIVPQPVVDLINAVIDLLNELVFEQIDPTICPVIGALAPGIPGVVDITTEGDVYLVTEFFWDCPPYEPET